MKERKPKPPIGIIPESIFEYQRAVELSEAINRYVSEGFATCELLGKWCDELIARIDNISLLEDELSSADFEVMKMARNEGGKIRCIKKYRELTSLSLRESKERVELLCDKYSVHLQL